ncbi:unnamed protein product [Camellia sinensis]
MLSLSSHLHLHLILLSFVTLQCLTVTTATCHVDDEASLLAFKSGITADPYGNLNSWKPRTNFCKWFGISCDGNNHRVTTLTLVGQPDQSNTSLLGTISPSLSKLHYLGGIYLQNIQNLSSPSPNLLFSLLNIEDVYIENSKLSGQIPVNIGDLTRLVALSFAGNQFSGPIPSSISKLTQPGQLKFGGNLLTGTVPTGIQQLKKLTLLSLDRNQLTSTVPDILSTLTELGSLSLSHNKFSGKIPSTILALAPKLIYLELGHNYFTGQIPDFLGSFHALDTLDLSWNRFSGTVPKSLGNLTKICNLDLSHNFLVDPFPEMNVKGIESLDLSHNGFSSECGIKIKLDDCKPVETYFYDYIDLSDNEISGSPVGLLNRTNYLVGFRASGNRIRFDMESVKFRDTLKDLDLSRNLVFGKLPEAISGLEKLNVSNNHLCGPIFAEQVHGKYVFQ